MSLFAALNEISNTGQLPFFIIGGHAVNAHGYSRFTKDVDILARSPDRAGWLAALGGRGFTLFHDGGSFLQMNPPAGELCPLDLMLVNSDTFNRIGEGSKEIDLDGSKFKVPSLENLFVLKFHALKQETPGRGFKDLTDVLSLAETNHTDLRSDSMRRLCEKYGSAKVYEKILALLG